MVLDLVHIPVHCEEVFLFSFLLIFKRKKGKENENYPTFAVTLLISLKIQKISLLYCNKIILGVQAKIKQS